MKKNFGESPSSTKNSDEHILSFQSSIPTLQFTSIAQQLLKDDKRTEAKRTPARSLKLLKNIYIYIYRVKQHLQQSNTTAVDDVQ